MDGFLAYVFDKDSWLAYVVVPILAVFTGVLISWTLLALLRYLQRRKPSELKQRLLQHLKRQPYFLISLLLLRQVVSYFQLGTLWEKFFEALIIGCFAWMLIGLVLAIEEVVKQKFELDRDSIASERKALTQLRFLKSIALVVIVTIAVSLILWNIPSARKVGNTLLTSAGVAGIIVGVAAQKSISNLIVGFQMAFTQALKINDEVVIEGEFGYVEDITLTYVVVRTWDWRRLILPLNYFNDKSYVNWTFNSRPLIASVHLYVDYTLPVDRIREALMGILEQDVRWNKHIAEVEVTNTTDRAMEVRATFSVENATDSWGLRCKVRELLIAFIQSNFREALPQLRRNDVKGIPSV